VALFSILKRAATEEHEFSRNERVLVTACEFWAAVSAGELRAHLGLQPSNRLQQAGMALTSLGAVVLAQAIFEGIDELKNKNSQDRLDEHIARLEHQLQMTDDPVDQLIGLLAQRCISDMMPIRQAAVEGHFR
jgi:hypothetical protein